MQGEPVGEYELKGIKGRHAVWAPWSDVRRQAVL